MDIKELAKKLCDESGCHHKCKEIDECVVMEEAEELLINQDKSNNFDVKSNNELFKQALVEGVNRHIDKTIEEAKKIEQIEEMARILCENGCKECIQTLCADWYKAERLYNAGYRKQSDGTPCTVGHLTTDITYLKDYLKQEWISVEDGVPMEGQNVLCYENGNYYIAFYENMDNVISWWDWVDFDRDNIWNEVCPTHWMPLPEAPKMKGGE